MLKKIINNKSLLFVIIYSVVGLAALFFLAHFWLPSGYTLGGHDSGLPFDAKDFLISRLFAWNDKAGFGMDNSFLFGSLTLHLLDFVSSLVGHTLFAGNWFNIFIWLSLIFLAATLFAYGFKDVLGLYFTFIFPPLVIFNFYLAQSFFIWERAKYSVLVGILIFLAIVFKLLDKKISILLAAVLTAFTFFFFNGGSFLGISLYGNLFVIILTFLFYYFISGILNKDFSDLRKISLFLLLTLFILLIINSYQLMPYIPNIFKRDYLTHLGTMIISQSNDWVNYISKDTSFLNIFRMQGIPNLYSEFGTASPEHSYAGLYFGNVLLIFVSFLFPALAFLSYLVAKESKQKRLILMFMALAIISIPFAAGTHPPFGSFYTFLYDNFPGFFIFRNPFYKFAGATFISICFLISATFSILLSRIPRKIISFAVCLLIIGGWFGFYYNLLLPEKVFTWKPGYSTRFKVPNYVWDFYSWNEQENTANGRILLLPAFSQVSSSDGYKWGYWSSSPLSYALSTVPAVVNEGDLTAEEAAWVAKIYSSLDDNNQAEFNSLSSKLGIRYILFRKDTIDASVSQGAEKSLSMFTNLKKLKSFGEWDLYQIENSVEPLISGLTSVSLVPNGSLYLTSNLVVNNGAITESDKTSIKNLSQFITQTIAVYTCQSCLMETIRQSVDFPAVRIFPGSPLYFLKEREEQKDLNAAKDDTSKIALYLADALRRNSEVKSMVSLNVDDKYIINNIEKINIYLNYILEILQKRPEFSRDYVMEQKILNIVTPLLNDLHRSVSTNYFSWRTGEVSQQINLQIKILNEISDYYLPSLPSFNYLRNNKIYSIGKETEVNIENESELPIAVWYKSENINIKLPLEESGGIDQSKFKLPENAAGNATLTLQFNLSNVFQFVENKILPFPGGNFGCISGKISDFESSKSYEVIVSANNKSQRLSLYDGSLYKLVDISPLETSIPFRFVYRPNLNSQDDSLLLCGEDRDTPSISSISVYEMISPDLEAVKNVEQKAFTQPKIDYKEINRTRYLVSVDSENPFILTFGQRFSPLWILYPAGSSWIKGYLSDSKSSNHFIIDGYQNAWVVDKKGKSEWILEYIPQRLFYIGSVVTVISFAGFGITAIWLIKRRRKLSDEKN